MFVRVSFVLIFLLSAITTFSQDWEEVKNTERGLLRVHVDYATSETYQFFFQNLQSQKLDTIRGMEHHHDFSLDFSLTKIYGVYPEKIYYDWNYATFPIAGISEGRLDVVSDYSSDTMHIYFRFDPNKLEDYVFNFEFRKGTYLIDAYSLKYFALAQNMAESHLKEWDAYLNPDSLLEKNGYRNLYYNLKNLTVDTRGEFSNPKLGIVYIGDLKPLEAYPFQSGVRYLHDDERSVRVKNYAIHKKIKYKPAYKQGFYPEFMEPTSHESDFAYCIENVYVEPLFLYRSNELAQETDLYRSTIVGPRIISPKNTRNQRIDSAISPANFYRQNRTDTTFYRLEELLNTLLFTRAIPCNADWYSYSDINVLYNADSIFCVEIGTRKIQLPDQDASIVMDYDKELSQKLDDFGKPIPPRKTKNRSKKEMSMPMVDKMPSGMAERLPMPNVDIDIPAFCDSLLFPPGTINSYHNGYWSWEPVIPCFTKDGDKLIPRRDSVEYVAFVLNPYTLEFYSPEELFGISFRSIVYQEMSDLYKELEAQGMKHPFNLYHYRPEEKRMMMWAFDKENLIIYYQNEGEFSAYSKHRIPLKRFVE